MSTCTHESMINHHGFGLFTQLLGRLSDTLHLWRHRYTTRRELAQWSERDLRDIGKSWSDVAHEVGKPFWRA
jgi:uncharacterized protein YjiS (DUF1127 family)